MTRFLVRRLSGLTNGTACTVIAVNSRGPSPASAKSTAVTIGIPAVPPTATAAPGNAQATVSWTAPSNNGSAITSYVVTRLIGGVVSGTTTFAGTGTTGVVTGLSPGTTYTFVVNAVNARGSGPMSPALPVQQRFEIVDGGCRAARTRTFGRDGTC